MFKDWTRKQLLSLLRLSKHALLRGYQAIAVVAEQQSRASASNRQGRLSTSSSSQQARRGRGVKTTSQQPASAAAASPNRLPEFKETEGDWHGDSGRAGGSSRGARGPAVGGVGVGRGRAYRGFVRNKADHVLGRHNIIVVPKRYLKGL
jgi:hypothetical protein